MSGRSLFQGTKVRCLIIKTRKEINLVFQNRVLTTGGIIENHTIDDEDFRIMINNAICDLLGIGEPDIY